MQEAQVAARVLQLLQGEASASKDVGGEAGFAQLLGREACSLKVLAHLQMIAVRSAASAPDRRGDRPTDDHAISLRRCEAVTRQARAIHVRRSLAKLRRPRRELRLLLRRLWLR